MPIIKGRIWMVEFTWEGPIQGQGSHIYTHNGKKFVIADTMEQALEIVRVVHPKAVFYAARNTTGKEEVIYAETS